jgi:hypothetical protein
MLRASWWKLVDDVQEAAEVAARRAEVRAWKTTGAAVKVRAGTLCWHSAVPLQPHWRGAAHTSTWLVAADG